MFIVRFAVRYFFGVLLLVGLNLVAWDRRDTRPDEEVDFNSQINFFTNPEMVTTNMMGAVGMVRRILRCPKLQGGIWKKVFSQPFTNKYETRRAKCQECVLDGIFRCMFC